MFGNNPFNEHRAAQKVQEGKFIIPEEIPANEKNAFMGAAAAAHKAGKSHFNFAGKKHKVTMSGDTAKSINSDTQKEALDQKDSGTVKKVVKGLKGAVKAHGAQVKSLEKDLKDDTQKEAVVDTHKSADKKPENYTDADGKIKTRMVATKRKKKASDGQQEGDINMNPKAEGSKAEQKESRIRRALMDVLTEGDRAKHYKGATKPETMDDKLKGKGAKDMVNQPKEVDDTEYKGHKDAADAGKVTKPAKQRNGGDQVRSGDQKAIPSATPLKGIMAAYKSMEK
tara:strand:+ start:516 stop:1364 length:849 start_codon:yes stop_codon:yes gene_type:complete